MRLATLHVGWPSSSETQETLTGAITRFLRTNHHAREVIGSENVFTTFFICLAHYVGNERNDGNAYDRRWVADNLDYLACCIHDHCGSEFDHFVELGGQAAGVDLGKIPTDVRRKVIARSRIWLRPFRSAEHYAWYESLVDQEPHGQTDFYSGKDLHRLISGGEVKAWIAHDFYGPVGWCAVQLRSPHHPLKEAVHFLGAIVDRPFRGRGFGFAMVAARLARFRNRPVTASILPGNVPKERMFRAAGFTPGLMQDQWRTWHLPHAKWLMILADRSEVVDELIRRGIYAERLRDPVEGGEGCIARGLWPDQTAFHAVCRNKDRDVRESAAKDTPR